ncbi:MAG: NADH-quinone oxidoreductase subunit H [Spirochaetes bacterium]|nr:NADH-quinone oxidoreductase subunit H [Spirochaetota bacterium]
MDIVFSIINVLLFLALAPLFEGLIRKIIARVQSRQGPPVIQPYRDLLKLLGKDNMKSGGLAFTIAPMLAFASILSVIAFLPLGSRVNILAGHADIITMVYLLTLGGVAVLLGALASRNTYAGIGSSREMITMIMVEPVLAMSFILGAVKVKSLMVGSAVAGVFGNGFSISAVMMLVAYLLALQAFVGRQPFDIAEAEVEILEGTFIEYSGPNYALFKYYLMLKQMFYASLFVVVFIPLGHTPVYALNMLIQLVCIALVYVVIALIGSTNPRLRIDQAQKYYAVLIAISLAAIGLSVYGL